MKTIADSMTVAQFADEVEHGGLDGDIEAGGRLVHDEQRGLGDQRHGDDDALLLSARKLVRVALEHGSGIGQVDLAENGEARERASSVPIPSWIIGTSMSCRRSA